MCGKGSMGSTVEELAEHMNALCISKSQTETDFLIDSCLLT